MKKLQDEKEKFDEAGKKIETELEKNKKLKQQKQNTEDELLELKKKKYYSIEDKDGTILFIEINKKDENQIETIQNHFNLAKEDEILEWSKKEYEKVGKKDETKVHDLSKINITDRKKEFDLSSEKLKKSLKINKSIGEKQLETKGELKKLKFLEEKRKDSIKNEFDVDFNNQNSAQIIATLALLDTLLTGIIEESNRIKNEIGIQDLEEQLLKEDEEITKSEQKIKEEMQEVEKSAENIESEVQTKFNENQQNIKEGIKNIENEASEITNEASKTTKEDVKQGLEDVKESAKQVEEEVKAKAELDEDGFPKIQTSKIIDDFAKKEQNIKDITKDNCLNMENRDVIMNQHILNSNVKETTKEKMKNDFENATKTNDATKIMQAITRIKTSTVAKKVMQNIVPVVQTGLSLG